MMDIFARIILGHLAGDYLLQSKTIALNKTKKGWQGLWCCTRHCLIYTATICLFLWNINPLLVILIFLSHWFIDRWSLAEKWLKLIKGRSIAEAYRSKDKYREIDIAFSCLVYAVADNTMHLIFLWLITKIL